MYININDIRITMQKSS